MQSPEQQPGTEPELPGHAAGEDMGAAPLYEYPPQPGAPTTRNLSEPQAAAPGPRESVQQPVYPPPPSFYENMSPEQIAARRATLHLQQLANVDYKKSEPSPSPINTQAPPTPPLAPPAAIQPLPPQQRSRTWIWIVVSVLGLAFLISCGLCSWAGVSMYQASMQQYTALTSVITDYYSDIQARDYRHAYQSLSPQNTIAGLTQEQFIQQAQAVDTRYGPVTSYAITTPPNDIDNAIANGESSMSIQVNVRRSSLSYTALLTLNKIGGNWKIVDFDRI